MRLNKANQYGGSPEHRAGCDDLLQSPDPGRLARRPLLRAAVLGQGNAVALHANAYASLLRPRPIARRLVLTGTLAAVRPSALVLRTRDGEERLAITESTTAWRGSAVQASALRPGDQVIVRKCAPGQAVVDKVWAEIGRVTGTIVAARPHRAVAPRRLELLVDEGPAKPPRVVVIAREAYRQILVRFPRLEPGYLIDVIGLRHRDFLQAVTPATAQPAYRADHPPAPPLVAGRVPNPVTGTAVWHEPGAEPTGVVGISYPALDPDSGCEHGQRGQHGDPHEAGPGCVRLPYLSVGSVVRMRNDCSGQSMPLPVTSCGASARLFCDRCVECRTSPRGRVADLTMTAFVELGGRLENGCFNASLSVTGLASRLRKE